MNSRMKLVGLVLMTTSILLSLIVFVQFLLEPKPTRYGPSRFMWYLWEINPLFCALSLTTGVLGFLLYWIFNDLKE